MEEIKFRSWNERLKKFFYFKDGRYFSDIKCELTNCVSERICEEFKWGNAQQYTGVRDKNSIEIYRGCILHMGDKKILYIVEWSDTGLKARQARNRSYAGIEYHQKWIEVIGSIDENPELLGGDNV